MTEKEPKNPDQIDAMRIAARSAPQPKRQTITPVAAEPDKPKLMEASPQAADEASSLSAAQGPVVSISAVRPAPPETKVEQGSVVVAKALAPQLGTDPELLGQGRWDERKMAITKELTLTAVSHFSYRYVYDGIRYWGHIVEWELTGSQGVGGIGRRHLLQAIASSSGVQSVEKAEKPNVIARNIWKRGWKEQAEKEGKIVE